MQSKEYKMPDGRTAIFEYDICEVGKITLESMDMLMGELIAYKRCVQSRSYLDAKHCDGCRFYDDCPFNPREIEDEPQTDIHDLTDCDFCKDRNCKDCEGGKDEPQTENPCDGCVCDDGKHLMYCMNCKGIAWKTEPPKVEDEPQTDCYVSDLCKHYGDKQICGRCRSRNLFCEAEPQPQTERSE